MFRLQCELISPSDTSFIPLSRRSLQLRSSSLKGDFSKALPMDLQDSAVSLQSEILLNKKKREELIQHNVMIWVSLHSLKGNGLLTWAGSEKRSCEE